MSANTSPRFTAKANLGNYVALAAGNTKNDGSGTIGTDTYNVLDAGTNGTFIERVDFLAVASVANTAVASVIARLFVSTQASGAITSANTKCIWEGSLPGCTGASSSGANPPIVAWLDFEMPPNTHLLASVHAAPNANTSWHANPIAGDF